MTGTAQVPRAPDVPCIKHTQQIEDLYGKINTIHTQLSVLQASVDREGAERRSADEDSQRVRKEILDAIGQVPDPIRGVPGSGIKGYMYALLMQQSPPIRQSMSSTPDAASEIVRVDLIARAEQAEHAAKTTHTKLVGTLIGAIIGGIVAAVTTAMSILGR